MIEYIKHNLLLICFKHIEIKYMYDTIGYMIIVYKDKSHIRKLTTRIA